MYLLARTGNREDALDLTGDVFLAAYAGWENFKGQSTFRTWVYGIAKNKLKGYYSKKSTIKENEIETSFEEMEEMIPADESTNEKQNTPEVNQKINEILKNLNEKEQDILTLHNINNLTFKECGEILGMKENAARVLHHRTIKKIK